QTQDSVVDSANPIVQVTALIEKPAAATAPSRLGVFGRYVLEFPIWDAIARTTPDSSGEVQLTDALNLLCKSDDLFGLLFEGLHFDAGDPLGYLKANIEVGLTDPRYRQALRDYLKRLEVGTAN